MPLLNATPEELKAQFRTIRSFDDMANLLEISPGRLNYVLYKIPLDSRYSTFEIPKKSGGTRVIANPVPAMKDIQYRLLEVLECIYERRCSAYGFIKGKSIVDNVKAHRKKPKYVLNIDLQDFFPSIHFGRVRGLFLNPPYNLSWKVSNWIAQICSFEYGLPQGAPTSPIVSNMICNKLDSQLQRLAQKHRCIYTRYADDITFSTTMPRFPSAIAERRQGELLLGDQLTDILDSNNFKVNREKIRLQEQSQRQEITGIIVNSGRNVRSKYNRQIRAMLYDWEKNGYDLAEQKHIQAFRQKHRLPIKPALSFRQIVRGKIEFLGLVRGKDDPLYRRYMLRLSELDDSVHFEVRSEVTEKSALIFLSYTRKDEDFVKELYDKLQRAGYKPWMDQKDIMGGEDWDLAIDRAIKAADLFVAVLSENSVNKRGVLQKEIKRALDKWQEKKPDDIFIIPLRIDNCEIPSGLDNFHCIDYLNPDGYNRLTQSIQESLRRASL